MIFWVHGGEGAAWLDFPIQFFIFSNFIPLPPPIFLILFTALPLLECSSVTGIRVNIYVDKKHCSKWLNTLIYTLSKMLPKHNVKWCFCFKILYQVWFFAAIVLGLDYHNLGQKKLKINRIKEFKLKSYFQPKQVLAVLWNPWLPGKHFCPFPWKTIGKNIIPATRDNSPSYKQSLRWLSFLF